MQENLLIVGFLVFLNMGLDNLHKKERRIAEDKLEVASSFIYREIKDAYKLEQFELKLKAIK